MVVRSFAAALCVAVVLAGGVWAGKGKPFWKK